MRKYGTIKREVIDSTRWLSEHGYLGKRGSGGNISIKARNEEVLAITPSGKPYHQIAVDDICVIDYDRQLLEGRRSPSIEAAMHIGVYKHRPDVNAVIHTHQTFATVLSSIKRPIPALFDEIIVEIGPKVEVIPYAFSGSSELEKNVVSKLGNECHCYLIQNHGALCLGADMDQAMKNAELLENVARIYYYALATGQEITVLPPTAIDHFAGMRKLRFKVDKR
jgi:ribulose-5-phosphate 4-epimerase/fuculose-1-phosphate aldolase